LSTEIDDILEAQTEIDTVYFKSNFKHLQDHNGHRPGELAALIGSKGSGKSTLLRSWILETLLLKKKTFLHLSEEVAPKYLMPIGKALIGVLKNKEAAQDHLNYLHTQSEKHFDNQYEQTEMITGLEYRIREFGAELVIIDNFTTSVMSRQGVSKEAEYAQKLTFLAEKLNVPIIVVCHTTKAFKNTGIASGEDIRGNASMANTAGIVYTVNSKLDSTEKPSFILVDKSRYHGKAHKSIYRLQYDATDRVFYQDIKSDYETASGFWKAKKERK
jgi:archaellum biogenesis ATPase FlaH